MVSINNCSVQVAYEVWSPGCKGVDHSKKFFVVYIPVSLCCIKYL